MPDRDDKLGAEALAIMAASRLVDVRAKALALAEELASLEPGQRERLIVLLFGED